MLYNLAYLGTLAQAKVAKSKNKPTNPGLYAKVKAEAKRKFDVYPCVPVENSFALTRKGWRKFGELQVGDEIVSYNRETDCLEWDEIQELHHYSDAPVMRIKKANTRFDFLCTPDHKWVIDQMPRQGTGATKVREYKYPDRLVPAKQISKNMRIRTSARMRDEETDAHLTIDDFTKGDSTSWVERVLHMSNPQREAWLAAAIVYDGHYNGYSEKLARHSYGFSQNNRDHAEAVEIAAALLGYNVTYSGKTANKSMRAYTITDRNYHSTGNIIKETDFAVVDVWCPATRNGTWLMKQGVEKGMITITGNSAYANGWLVQQYKKRGGGYKKARLDPVALGIGTLGALGGGFSGLQAMDDDADLSAKLFGTLGGAAVGGAIAPSALIGSARLGAKAVDGFDNLLNRLGTRIDMVPGGQTFRDKILPGSILAAGVLAPEAAGYGVGSALNYSANERKNRDSFKGAADEEAPGLGSAACGTSKQGKEEPSLTKEDKNPKGGLSAKGRKKLRAAGQNIRPGVKGKADTTGKKKRKGSFLARHYCGPAKPLKKDGKKTRHALQATAWGESAPTSQGAARELCNKGRNHLEAAKNKKEKKAALSPLFSLTTGYTAAPDASFGQRAATGVGSTLGGIAVPIPGVGAGLGAALGHKLTAPSDSPYTAGDAGAIAGITSLGRIAGGTLGGGAGAALGAGLGTALTEDQNVLGGLTALGALGGGLGGMYLGSNYANRKAKELVNAAVAGRQSQ